MMKNSVNFYKYTTFSILYLVRKSKTGTGNKRLVLKQFIYRINIEIYLQYKFILHISR